MKINQDLCIRCEKCAPYCPVAAIKVDALTSIDQDLCVECGVCVKSGICPVNALFQPELRWPRNLMAQFSDPLCEHPATGIKGRGTAEMKTNDVTGRFKPGEVGFAIELGRPGVSACFADVETIATSIAHLVEFEPQNPVTFLLDPRTGQLKDPTLRRARVLSAIIEAKTTEDQGVEVLSVLKEVSRQLDTVFSLCVINRCRNGVPPFRAIMEAVGFEPRINGKTNLGLGRPLA